VTAVEAELAAGRPLHDARTQLRAATDLLGYDEGMFAMLAAPRREVAAWDGVSAYARQLARPLRLAATALAVERVAQAHVQRGLYP